jgi:hypothetical protein
LGVCVYNYAEVEERLLASTQRIAGNIFREAGVELRWVDCALVSPDSTVLYLRLLSAPMAERLRFRPKEFGVALLSRDEAHASNAYIFYDKVIQMVRQGRVLRPELLGHVFAHEIGHLLLGNNSHSRTGIMQSLWSGGTMEQVNQRRLFFSAGEAERIRAQVRARTYLVAVGENRVLR